MRTLILWVFPLAALTQSCDPNQVGSEFRRLPAQTLVEDSVEVNFEGQTLIEATFEHPELEGLKVGFDGNFMNGNSVVLTSAIVSGESGRVLNLSSSQTLKEGGAFTVELPISILGAESPRIDSTSKSRERRRKLAPQTLNGSKKVSCV